MGINIMSATRTPVMMAGVDLQKRKRDLQWHCWISSHSLAHRKYGTVQ